MITSLIAFQTIACVAVSLYSSSNIIIAQAYRKKVKKATMKGGI